MSFFLGDKHIAITYHYVEDPSDKRRGIFPCSINEFERQIKFLSQHYTFASIDEVYNDAKKAGDNRLCAITFDDGLKDQYENALPILEKYKAIATFFIISGIYEGCIPAAHKIHILLSIKEPSELIHSFNKHIGINFPKEASKLNIPENVSITDKRRHERKTSIKNFKEAISQLSIDRQKSFFKWIFKEYNLDEGALIKEFFMSVNQIKELLKRGFNIGNHTNNHPAFDSISVDEVKKDVLYSQKKIYSLFNKEPNVFCYPYGRLNDDMYRMYKVLEDANIKYGVTTEPREIKKTDDSFIIPRYDTNDIRDFLNKNNV